MAVRQSTHACVDEYTHTNAFANLTDSVRCAVCTVHTLSFKYIRNRQQLRIHDLSCHLLCNLNGNIQHRIDLTCRVRS